SLKTTSLDVTPVSSAPVVPFSVRTWKPARRSASATVPGLVDWIVPLAVVPWCCSRKCWNMTSAGTWTTLWLSSPVATATPLATGDPPPPPREGEARAPPRAAAPGRPPPPDPPAHVVAGPRHPLGDVLDQRRAEELVHRLVLAAHPARSFGVTPMPRSSPSTA